MLSIFIRDFSFIVCRILYLRAHEGDEFGIIVLCTYYIDRNSTELSGECDNFANLQSRIVPALKVGFRIDMIFN